MLPARSQPWGTRACQSWAAVEMAASSNHGICEILLRSILWRQKTMLHQDLLWDVWVNASSSFFSFFFEFSILESANNCLDARFMMQGWERLPRPVFSRNSLPALDLLNLPTFLGPSPSLSFGLWGDQMCLLKQWHVLCCRNIWGCLNAVSTVVHRDTCPLQQQQ